jgi:hypothetical protein
MTPPEIIVIHDSDSDDCPQPRASKSLQALATASGPRHQGTSLRPKSEPIQSQRRIDVIDVDSDADGRPVSLQITSLYSLKPSL